MSGVFYTWIFTSIRIKFKSFRNWAMSSVHDRLAECEQRNGGHLEDVIFRVERCVAFFFFFFLCCFKTTDSLISANAKVCTSL